MLKPPVAKKPATTLAQSPHAQGLADVVARCQTFRPAKGGFVFSFEDDLASCFVADHEFKAFHPGLLPAASAIYHLKSNTQAYAERLRASLQHWETAPIALPSYGSPCFIARVTKVHNYDGGSHVTVNFDGYYLAKIAKTEYAVDYRNKNEVFKIVQLDTWYPDAERLITNAQMLGYTPEQVADVLNTARDAHLARSRMTMRGHTIDLSFDMNQDA